LCFCCWLVYIYFLTKINETIFNNKNENNLDKELNNLIKDYEKSEYLYDKINENTLNILLKKGNKEKYYSLIFTAIPFALKILNKDKLIKEIESFINKYTNDNNQIIASIAIGLMINYAINEIDIKNWIKNLIKDLDSKKENEKYIDYLNDYYENNFRNNIFIKARRDNLVSERNEIFFKNYCENNNTILTENPFEQVLFIYDTLIRSNDNWEQLILYGMVNYNENIIISLILGLLYEIIFSYSKINKNLLKRFSF